MDMKPRIALEDEYRKAYDHPFDQEESEMRPRPRTFPDFIIAIACVAFAVAVTGILYWVSR